MKIQDLLRGTRRDLGVGRPEMDALREEGALQEAGLLQVHFDALRSDLWLLLDCRGAFQIRTGNVAVVAIHGVREFAWEGELRHPRTWRAVVGWEPITDRGVLTLKVSVAPSGQLRAVGGEAEFYVGNVPGGDSAPPDLATASDEEVRAGFAGWSSEFVLVNATFLAS